MEKINVALSVFVLGLLACTAPAQAAPVEAEVDLFELHLGDGDEHFTFDSTVTAGSDTDRIVLKASGGSDVGPLIDNVQLEALYARTLSDSVTVMAGMRQDVREGSDLTFASVAVDVAVTDWLAAEHFLYLSESGNVIGSAQALASLPLSASISIEPRLNINWSAQDIPGEDTGGGVTDIQAAVRLRKTLLPHVEAYAGAIHERLLGRTRVIALAAGDRGSVNRVIVGMAVRF
ncbi:MAG: hypothetical protein C0409_03480 [Novosphingobium sp.]|nr:hypothetical protein [Novosphingobium sp.]